MSSLVSGLRSYRRDNFPGVVLGMAGGFWLVGLLLQFWRLESLTATYDQALFLQELWSTARGHFFESSLSSELSAAVANQDALPSIDYLHLGQHANVLTVLAAPLVALFGRWALPLIQVGLLALAGLVLWRMASARLSRPLAIRLTASYYLSGTVIGPLVENFHDLCWLPLLGFLVVDGLLKQGWRQVMACSFLMLFVREDAGLTLFSLGLWASLRRPGARAIGLMVMAMSLVYVAVMTGWIQPQFDSSLSDRFLQEKFGHLLQGRTGGTFTVLWTMVTHPLRLLAALVSPPGTTLAFLLAPALPLAFIPFVSLDVALMVAVPLFIALVSQGMSALSVTLRYVLALVPGLFMGAMLWWQAHPGFWSHLWFRRFWTGCLALGLVLTLASNPHRTFSALVPDSFSPFVHVSPVAMLQRAATARHAVGLVPDNASVAADTPLLPLLAEREVALRFPKHIEYYNRRDQIESVQWVLAFPGYYRSLMPLFRQETSRWRSINKALQELMEEGRYGVVSCADGLVVLRNSVDSSPDAQRCLDALLALEPG
ncbi:MULTISPECIES: DUF2079 domain-containing protein [Prochlorococcus]|uniref:DUF2079 domain-containing protein n=1 Tax=Prochlorococcus TaxID=1218 RepID=UPI001F120272|nr:MULTISPECIES: DUF2079 domain-containing protein [Prochlorococcus]